MALHTFHYEYPDGALAERITTAAEPEHPAGVTLLSAEDYATKKTALEAAEAQRRADVQAAETTAKQDAYEALLAAGIPDAAAQQISGYRPPQEPAA